MIIHSLYNFFLPHFRKRRKRLFHRLIRLNPTHKILDVGGYPWFWLRMDCSNWVTCLNLDIPHLSESPPAQFTYVQGDGRCLPYRDGEFEIVFSNSVIEHVGDAASQRRFAAEVTRVGRRFWVQTPNRRFPVEQHLLTPFVHWLPRAWQHRIVPRFTVWTWLVRPARDRRDFYLEHYLNEVRLLDAAEMAALFPGASILRERFLGCTKSLVAVKAR